jgi:hypothetical protein
MQSDASDSTEARLLELIRGLVPVPTTDTSGLLIMRDLLRDSECYETLAERVTAEFRLRVPEVRNLKEYKRQLRARRGFHISDIFRHAPALHVPDMTIGAMADIIRRGEWPETFLLPPPQ